MLEIVHPEADLSRARVALFDFDGTISLIRSGWMEIMVSMFMAELQKFTAKEEESQLVSDIEDSIHRLTGKDTIYQMHALTNWVKDLGGSPLEPADYKRLFLDRLLSRVRVRLNLLESTRAVPAQYLVPGVLDFITTLKERGLALYLASGTDDPNLQEEARALDLLPFFGNHIYGARNDGQGFNKAALVLHLLGVEGYKPEELLVFGDGFIEVDVAKKVGGFAVGVATDEPECRVINEGKRKHLLRAGADMVIPNFSGATELLQAIFERNNSAGSSSSQS
jgi:phosphoglycolate phosphatase